MGVTIEPPYQPESIKSREDNKALNHIRKIVEKHIHDLETKKCIASTTSTSALSVAASPSAATVAETPATSTNSRTSTPSVTPSIPNLPQAPAPGQPSSHSGTWTRMIVYICFEILISFLFTFLKSISI